MMRIKEWLTALWEGAMRDPEDYLQAKLRQARRNIEDRRHEGHRLSKSRGGTCSRNSLKARDQ